MSYVMRFLNNQLVVLKSENSSVDKIAPTVSDRFLNLIWFSYTMLAKVIRQLHYCNYQAPQILNHGPKS